MTKRNRNTLTDNFTTGAMPSQEEFADLIDSVVNIVDDGFEKSPKDGWKVAQLGNDGKLMSFYDQITVKSPLWSIAFSMSGYGGDEAGRKNLNLFCGEDRASGLTLAMAPGEEPGDQNRHKVRVGVNQSSPDHELDVQGTVASNARVGRAGKRVPADGQWHPIVQGLNGCQALEVMAGVGKKNSGKYALMHAFALNTFNSKKSSISYHQAHYLSKCDKIELRWAAETGKETYALEMRTRCSYGADGENSIYICYHITELWQDPFMEGCIGEPGPAPQPDGKQG